MRTKLNGNERERKRARGGEREEESEYPCLFHRKNGYNFIDAANIDETFKHKHFMIRFEPGKNMFFFYFILKHSVGKTFTLVLVVRHKLFTIQLRDIRTNT